MYAVQQNQNVIRQKKINCDYKHYNLFHRNSRFVVKNKKKKHKKIKNQNQKVAREVNKNAGICYSIISIES